MKIKISLLSLYGKTIPKKNLRLCHAFFTKENDVDRCPVISFFLILSNITH